MASLNKVMLIGNLTRDPEVRHTPKGTAVGDLSMAINMNYRTQDGSEKEEVCYVDIVVWGRQAETCQDYLSKGRQIFVEGRLQLDQWETQQGEKRSRLRVRADRVQFLGGGGGGRTTSRDQDSADSSPKNESSRDYQRGPEDYGNETAPDDDIPF
jgi:single-strand DNA-binding protein